MTALAAAAPIVSRGELTYRKYLMTASKTVYAGGMVMIVSAGTAEAAAAVASNKGVVGVATETVTSAASGNYYVTVAVGEFLFAGDSLGQDDVNVVVYADDDATIDETQVTNGPKAGILIEYVGTASGWVLITPELNHA